MRNISAWSIRNPVIPLVLFAFLLAMGLRQLHADGREPQSGHQLPGRPDLDQPARRRADRARDPDHPARRGGGARDQRRRPRSTRRSARAISTTFVKFEIGTPIDRAVTDVRDAVAQIRADLPDGILEPQVERVDNRRRADRLFLGRKHGMTLEQLSWFIDDTLNRRLLGIEGVARWSAAPAASAARSGSILDPVRHAGAGRHRLARSISSCAQINMNAAGGRAEIAGSEQSVRVLGKRAHRPSPRPDPDLDSAAAARSGSPTSPSVRDHYAEQRSYGDPNGRQVVSFMIQQAKGYSDVTVYHDGCRGAGRSSSARIPASSSGCCSPRSNISRRSMIARCEALIEGAVLAVLVVFLFLRDWRATLISAIAIPLSAIPAFWFMELMGFTLNMVTLLALSLVAGVLVDDAIVEIENIVRHMRMGKTAYQASIDAADEIGLPVVGDDLLDRRRVPAGRHDARHHRPVFQATSASPSSSRC